MKTGTLARLLSAAAFALVTILVGAARAQEPSPGAVALARELIALKGAANMYDPIIPGVIEQAKSVFVQTNPALGKELNDVAGQLRSEYAPRATELSFEVARLYAQKFSEPELREALAFYKTPLGRKITTEEPKILEESFGRVNQWANRFSEEVMNKIRVEMKKKGHNL